MLALQLIAFRVYLGSNPANRTSCPEALPRKIRARASVLGRLAEI